MTFEQYAEATKRSLSHIRQLTGIVRGYTVKHSSDKLQGATRLRVALTKEFGEAEADVIAIKVLMSNSCEEALYTLKARLIALHQERGQPTNLLEATIINGIGRHFTPGELKESDMEDQTTNTPQEEPEDKATIKGGKGSKGSKKTTEVVPKNLSPRKSIYGDKFLTCTKDANPRKEGSWGHKSIGIIMAKPGISYADYIAAGGRLNDLDWDVKKGNVTLSDAAPAGHAAAETTTA